MDSAISRMWTLTSSDTPGRPLKAYETVAGETPEARATAAAEILLVEITTTP